MLLNDDSYPSLHSAMTNPSYFDFFIEDGSFLFFLFKFVLFFFKVHISNANDIYLFLSKLDTIKFHIVSDEYHYIGGIDYEDVFLFTVPFEFFFTVRFIKL